MRRKADVELASSGPTDVHDFCFESRIIGSVECTKQQKEWGPVHNAWAPLTSAESAIQLIRPCFGCDSVQEQGNLDIDAGNGLRVKGLIGPTGDGDYQRVVLNRYLMDIDRCPRTIQQQKQRSHPPVRFARDRGNSLNIRMAVNANIEEYSGSRFIGAVACYGIEAGRWKICSLDNHLDQNRFKLWRATHPAM